MSFNNFTVCLIALSSILGIIFFHNQAIAVLQISGGWGQSYWNANFSAPGWGSFSGGGGSGGSGGILTEADMKIVIEALIDPLFGEGKIDFETALCKYVNGGQAVYDKMMAINPEYYQGFMDYVGTSEGKQAALDNLGNLLSNQTVVTTKTQAEYDSVAKDIVWALRTSSVTTLTDAQKQAIISKTLAKNGISASDPLMQAALLKQGITPPSSSALPSGQPVFSTTGPDYEGAEKFLNSIKGRGLAESEVAKGLASFGFECTNGICKEAGTNRVATGDSSGSKADINSRYFWATEGACLDGPNLGSIGSGAEETLSGSPSCSGGGGGGTPTAPACTSYTYSDWSACGGGVQARSILHQYPSGCTDTATAVLTQNCTMPTVVCASYVYSDWSACVDNNQTRSIQTKSPSGCGDSSSAVLTQSCVSPISPVVTNTTNANQTMTRPLLSVSTNRAATCQFNENGGFAYPAGTTFDTTGGYNHNSQLPETANGKKTCYVVCRDNTTGGISDALKIEFTVNVESVPIIASVTPAEQTGANPALSVTTDRPAICQYQKDSAFSFGSGAPLSTTDNYSHTVSVANLSDGDYLFYVICKNNDTGTISPAKQVATKLHRQSPANAPAVTNTTAVAQAMDNPILSVSTNIAAACQYQKDAPFAYGQGLSFSRDNDKKNHQAQLNNLADGTHTYYVICKNDTAEAQSELMMIMFVVNAGQADVCADLVSNDRKNNANRSYWGNQNSNSAYLWQAVETGTRDKFEKVDWHAGYQFTPEKDGKVSQLCGNFAAGTANRVSLYDGSYTELAGVQITGNDAWKCADIAPVEIKTDRRYYVIARIDNNPVYFEYKSGMLPKRTGNAVIEAGIRQSAGQQAFDYDIRKYDYMIFGLVDARVSWSPATLNGPAFITAGPNGTVAGDSTVLSLITSGASECRFGREDVDYAQMSYLMGKTAADNFAQKVCGLEAGDYTFYARCRNTGGAENNMSAAITFTITQ